MENMREKTEIDKLCSQSGVAPVLLYLLDHEHAILSDFIYDLRMHGATVSRSLNLLLQLGCVKEERQEYNRRVFTLTNKGRKVAEKLKEIAKIIGPPTLSDFVEGKINE